MLFSHLLQRSPVVLMTSILLKVTTTINLVPLILSATQLQLERTMEVVSIHLAIILLLPMILVRDQLRIILRINLRRNLSSIPLRMKHLQTLLLLMHLAIMILLIINLQIQMRILTLVLMRSVRVTRSQHLSRLLHPLLCNLFKRSQLITQRLISFRSQWPITHLLKVDEELQLLKFRWILRDYLSSQSQRVLQCKRSLLNNQEMFQRPLSRSHQKKKRLSILGHQIWLIWIYLAVLPLNADRACRQLVGLP
mmetsp:Transcript_9789/g.10540  ORF Transcript_9789/g.10540 Transcript_9789/m.10540 type:complete len:252 (-) Transcript_9789:785-1540(-)